MDEENAFYESIFKSGRRNTSIQKLWPEALKAVLGNDSGIGVYVAEDESRESFKLYN